MILNNFINLTNKALLNKNFLSTIKTDNLLHFLNFIKNNPNLIVYKNKNNDNLFKLSADYEAYKISKYLFENHPSLVLERNNQKEPAFWYALKNEGLATLIDKHTIKNNLEIENIIGENILMFLANNKNQASFVNILEISENYNNNLCINHKNHSNENLLHYIASNNIKINAEYFETIKELDTNLMSTNDFTPLMLAIKQNNNNEFLNYLMLHSEINKINKFGKSFVNYAIESNNNIDYLFKPNVIINHYNSFDLSPIFISIKNNNFALFEKILNSNSNYLFDISPNGHNSFFYICKNLPKTKVFFDYAVEKILTNEECLSKLNNDDYSKKRDILSLIAAYGEVADLKKVIYKINITKKSNDILKDPIVSAISSNVDSIEKIKILLEFGFKLNSINDFLNNKEKLILRSQFNSGYKLNYFFISQLIKYIPVKSQIKTILEIEKINFYFKENDLILGLFSSVYENSPETFSFLKNKMHLTNCKISPIDFLKKFKEQCGVNFFEIFSSHTFFLKKITKKNISVFKHIIDIYFTELNNLIVIDGFYKCMDCISNCIKNKNYKLLGYFFAFSQKNLPPSEIDKFNKTFITHVASNMDIKNKEALAFINKIIINKNEHIDLDINSSSIVDLPKRIQFLENNAIKINKYSLIEPILILPYNNANTYEAQAIFDFLFSDPNFGRNIFSHIKKTYIEDNLIYKIKDPYLLSFILDNIPISTDKLKKILIDEIKSNGSKTSLTFYKTLVEKINDLDFEIILSYLLKYCRNNCNINATNKIFNFFIEKSNFKNIFSYQDCISTSYYNDNQKNLKEMDLKLSIKDMCLFFGHFEALKEINKKDKKITTNNWLYFPFFVKSDISYCLSRDEYVALTLTTLKDANIDIFYRNQNKDGLLDISLKSSFPIEFVESILKNDENFYKELSSHNLYNICKELNKLVDKKDNKKEVHQLIRNIVSKKTNDVLHQFLADYDYGNIINCFIENRILQDEIPNLKANSEKLLKV